MHPRFDLRVFFCSSVHVREFSGAISAQLFDDDARSSDPTQDCVVDHSLKQKLPALPNPCAESICRFTPTCKLTSLCFSVILLPEAWSLSLSAELRKRPLSIGDDLPYHQADDTLAIFDAAGAKVAIIRRPKAFRFSPLCELVESAALNARHTTDRLYAVYGDDLLPHLPHVTRLTLVLRDFRGMSYQQNHDENRCPLESSFLAHLLPNLTSLTIINSGVLKMWLYDAALAYCLRDMPIHEMAGLRRLLVPAPAFGDLMRLADEESPARDATCRVLAGLSSLGVWQETLLAALQQADLLLFRDRLLRFLPAYCGQLSTLYVRVSGKFQAYLAAFRSLTGLKTLGLRLPFQIDLDGLSFSRNEAIGSVTDLRFICSPHPAQSQRTAIFSVASFFPHAKDLSLQAYVNVPDALDLASELCVKRSLATLSCFMLGESSASSSERLVQLLSNHNLPEAVDLSQVVFEVMSRDPDLLTDIYREMRTNSTKLLLMRGPLHREALSRLQSHVDLSDEESIRQIEELSPQTDFRIVGEKNCGGLKGEQFTIRVIDQLAKRHHIFE